MKKNATISRGMSVSIVCLALSFMLMMNSCTKKEVMDVTDLVKTVPSSASMVAAVNIHSLVEKTGGKVKDSEIVPGKQLEELSASGNLSGLEEVVGNLKGVDPEGMIYFKDAYDNYFTFLLSDTKEFMDQVASSSGSSFEDKDGVSVCGNVAVKGVQAWVNVNSGSIDERAIKNYSSLNESQSFLSNPVGPKFVDSDDDIVLWSLLKEIGMGGIPVPSVGGVAQMISGALFDNPDAALLTVEFGKGELKAEGLILNSKGDRAKYLLPAEKIDVDQIKSLATTASLVAGIAMPKSLVEKIVKMASSFGGSGLGLPDDALKAIDGTIGVAMSMNPSKPFSDVSGFVTTDGKGSTELMNFISNFGPTKKDGKLIRFSEGTVSGMLDVATAVESIKGSTFGVVVGFEVGKESPAPWLHSSSLALVPEKGSVAVRVVVKSNDQSENILLSILKSHTQR